MSNTYNSGFDFTREDVLKMLAAVHSLINETWQAYNQYDKEPASNSLALQEQQTFPNQELIRGVHYGGILSMESASDHLRVFADSMPNQPIPPRPCFVTSELPHVGQWTPFGQRRSRTVSKHLASSMSD
jgi:hypothetical protein